MLSKCYKNEINVNIILKKQEDSCHIFGKTSRTCLKEMNY